MSLINEETGNYEIPGEIVHRNIAECRQCGDIIESVHRHDFVECKCGAIFTDGGRDYRRRGAKDLNDIIDHSEVTPVIRIYTGEGFNFVKTVLAETGDEVAGS